MTARQRVNHIVTTIVTNSVVVRITRSVIAALKNRITARVTKSETIA